MALIYALLVKDSQNTLEITLKREDIYNFHLESESRDPINTLAPPCLMGFLDWLILLVLIGTSVR